MGLKGGGEDLLFFSRAWESEDLNPAAKSWSSWFRPRAIVPAFTGSGLAEAVLLYHPNLRGCNSDMEAQEHGLESHDVKVFDTVN